MLSMTSVTFAAYNDDEPRGVFIGEAIIEGENVRFFYREEDGVTEVEAISVSRHHIVQVDRRNNTLVVDGQLEGSFYDNPLIQPLANVEAGDKEDRLRGNIGTDIRDVTTVTAILVGGFLALNIPGMKPYIMTGAAVLASTIVARGLDEVWYEVAAFYDDETLDQQRPTMWYTIYVYADEECTDLIYTFNER